MAVNGNPVQRSLQERRLLRLLYIGTIGLLAVFLLATVRTFEKYSTANKEVRENNAVLQELASMVSGLKDAQTGAWGYILTHDTSFMVPFNLAQPAVERSILRLDSLTRAGASTPDLHAVQAMARQMLKQIQEQFLAEHGSDVGVQAGERGQLEKSRALMDRIRAEHARLALDLEGMRDANLHEERSLEPDTPVMLLVYAVLAILATSLLFWRLFRALAKAERAEVEILRKVDELNKEVRTREFAERSLKRVLDTSPNAIMAFRSVRDKVGRIVDFEWILANRECLAMYAHGNEQLIGKHLLDQLPWVRKTDWFEGFIAVVESGVPLELDQHAEYRPGTWHHVRAVRLLDGLVVTVTDISETRRAQDLLAEEDRLAITGGIARTIAHEVRNPLTNLNMALEQMLEELTPEVREDLKPFSDILRRNMQRIGKLITDLLESSKTRELNKRPCDVHTLLLNAAGSVRDRLDLLHMQCEVKTAEGLANVLADPEMFGVALTNLCINAVEAMEEGRGHLRLTADMHKDHVRICVQDNGKGIEERNIQDLFRAFYSGRSGGMGLGLTSARTILNAHGVHIDVKSAVGQGTTFALTFPD
jgi:signal transduction histidine kinase